MMPKCVAKPNPTATQIAASIMANKRLIFLKRIISSKAATVQVAPRCIENPIIVAANTAKILKKVIIKYARQRLQSDQLFASMVAALSCALYLHNQRHDVVECLP